MSCVRVGYTAATSEELFLEDVCKAVSLMRARNVLFTRQVQGESVTAQTLINVLVGTHGVRPLKCAVP